MFRIVARTWANALGLIAAGAFAYTGCDSGSTTLGGETNWLAICTMNSQCTGGTECLCGVCTKACSNDAACNAPGIRCATAGSPAFESECRDERTGPGICLASCTADGCKGTATCSNGFCVRPPTRDGGPSDGNVSDHAAAGGGPNRPDGTGGIHDASADRDARTDASEIDATITDGSCGVTGPWPASPAAPDASCTPNCDASGCGSLCPTAADGITGMPCATGCCASNTARLTVVPDPGSSQTGGPVWTSLAISPQGTIYCGMSGGAVLSSGTAPFSYAATNDATAQSWAEQGTPDNAILVDAGVLTGAAVPQFAFGKSGGSDAVFALYFPSFRGEPQRDGRFGVRVGGAWSFEDLPSTTGVLSADSAGAALVLTGDHVLYRNARGGWTSVCIPDPGAGSGVALATDADGAWYVARNGTDHVVRVSRRDPSGSWTTEAVTSGTPPAFAASIAWGAGTIHLAYTVGAATDASADGGGDLYYARRVGTAWVSHAVALAAALPGASPGARPSIGPAYLTLDDCGAPHFAFYTRGAASFDAYYYRWTPVGFRGARFKNDCDPVLSGGIALSSSDALLSFWSCAFQTAAIPR